MGQTKALPRILSTVVRYQYADRFSVDVTTDDPEHRAYVLDMTADQYRATRNHIADTGSAPIPTGENA